MQRMDEIAVGRLFGKCSWLVDRFYALVVRMCVQGQVCDWAVAVDVDIRNDPGCGRSSCSVSRSSPDSRQDPGEDRDDSPGGSLLRRGSRYPHNSLDSLQHRARTGQGHTLEHNVDDSWPLMVQ